MRFTIALPVWGEEFVERFRGMPLNSHVDALAGFDGDVRYLLYTDQERLAAEIEIRTHRPVECRPLKFFRGHYSMLLRCHQDALAYANGDALVLLNGDNLVSVEAFEAIWARIRDGKKLVMCCGTRTDPKEDAPRAASSRDLLAWTLRNPHQITRDLIWCDGRSAHPSLLYFRRGESMVVRGFHLHPIAIVVDQEFQVDKSIDWNLGERIERDDIHVVCDPDEMALAEISPASKVMPRQEARYSLTDVASWARTKTTDFHWWLLEHPIRLAGDEDCGDDEAVAELMRRRGLWE